MKQNLISTKTKDFIQLLRWNKPTGRLILLIPAGWSLWLTPSSPPPVQLIFVLLAGGIFISGAGCIANDLWDRNIDKQVLRTAGRPLSTGKIKVSSAWVLLLIMLSLSLLTVFALPLESRTLCIKLAWISILPILIYPSAKRWFRYPQLILAICWGFSVLIPWAASESSLNGGVPLLACWGATISWTFGFDTVYAMADKKEDSTLGLNSSALSLGKQAIPVISLSYAITCILLGIAAFSSGINLIFWPILLVSSLTMQQQIYSLKGKNSSIATSGRHFKNQAWIGSIILVGLILGGI